MAFAHERMTWKSLRTEYLRPDGAMTYIWAVAMTMDAWRVGTQDAYVVKHSRLFDKLAVGTKFGMGVAYLQCLVCYSTAVDHEYMAQLVV